jgi:hypothetical protein
MDIKIWWSWTLVERPLDARPLDSFPAFHATRRFSTEFTRALHLFLSLARIRFPALPEKKVVGLERGPLSLVSTTEELLDRKVVAPV